jgi:hypothetical protein
MLGTVSELQRVTAEGTTLSALHSGLASRYFVASPADPSVLMSAIASLALTLCDLRLPNLILGREDAPLLAQLTALTHLDVQGNRLGNALSVLSSLTLLQHLNIAAAAITTLNLGALTALRTLQMGWNVNMDGLNLSALSACPHLCNLHLQRMRFTSRDADDLWSLTSLEQLALLGAKGFRTAALKRLPALATLILNEMFDDEPAEFAAAMLHVARLPSLRALSVGDCTGMSTSSLTPLSALTALRCLLLDDTSVARGHFTEVARICGLDFVSAFNGGPASGECLSELRPLTKLRNVGLTIYRSTMDCLQADLVALQAGIGLETLYYESSGVEGPDGAQALERILNSVYESGVDVRPRDELGSSKD